MEGENTYAFVPPPRTLGPDLRQRARLRVACAASATDAASFDEEWLTYDGSLEPNPITLDATPQGEDVAVTSTLTITFTRAVDPATVTVENFGIRGVSGTIDAHDPRRKTYFFLPDAPLAHGTTYLAFVKAGPSGVRSNHARKELKPTRAPGDGTPSLEEDAWTFTTR